jgi:hypothetical protein
VAPDGAFDLNADLEIGDPGGALATVVGNLYYSFPLPKEDEICN